MVGFDDVKDLENYTLLKILATLITLPTVTLKNFQMTILTQKQS